MVFTLNFNKRRELSVLDKTKTGRQFQHHLGIGVLVLFLLVGDPGGFRFEVGVLTVSGVAGMVISTGVTPGVAAKGLTP